MPSTSLLVEAEAMTLENYRLETDKSHASGGGNISLIGESEGEVGYATWEFSGEAGWYHLNLGYFDEADGVSQLEILVDDEPLNVLTLDRDLGDNGDSEATAVKSRVANDVFLEPGQTITIVGREQEAEGARVDYLKLLPTAAPTDSLDENDSSAEIVYPGSTIFQSDFNSGLEVEGLKPSGFDNPASAIVANPDPAAIGDYSAKFVLEDPDKREELSLNTVPYNSEITYHFRTFLPEDYVADSPHEIVAQWHALPDFDLGETWAGSGPVLSLLTKEGQWQVGRKWDSRQIIREPGQRGTIESEGSASYELGEHQTGVWTDWTFHVKWSYEDDGLLEVWQDNNLVVRETGPNAYNDAVGPYLKFGLYNKKWQETELTKRELYYDDIEVLEVEAEIYLLSGGEEDNIFVLNSQTAPASQIQDTGGDDTLFLGDIEVDLTGLARENDDLLIDANRDGVFDANTDVTILDYFFGSAIGTGAIETVGNLDSTEIFTAFGEEVSSLAI